MSHWYCRTCKEKKEPNQVTFQENCEDCGTDIEWVEVMRSVLFSKPAGDYYELTGRKPLALYRNKTGPNLKTATPDYMAFLESKYQQ